MTVRISGCGEGAPIAQLEEVAGLCDIALGERREPERLASAVDEMVEAACCREKGFDRGFAGKVDRPALGPGRQCRESV
jgi:hypothetical protein